jgi:eukaryotic-like serine/threonine-protein kinase
MNGAARDPRNSGAHVQIEGTPTTAFGKYQLFASLGRGGMADVFLSVARGQMGFNKLAVIKRLRQALAEEPAFRNMFLDEARLAARLNHPNIVHTYEVGEQNGVYFIAMEYLEGQSLNKVLKEALRRKENIEPEICARIVADALAGLHHAHTLCDYDGRPLSIIHRDVSPHNIFVTYDGHTKLVDFGIAKAALSSTETEVGVLKGKVAYMSPEQAMGGRIDCRSDLFAMGIVLWELLARQRLMTGDNAANTLHKLMNEAIPRVAQAVPTIDPTLDMIVGRALEKDPNRRFQSATEMKDALEAWLSVQPRVARQDDVGRKMQGLFVQIREEVHRQIQRHMQAITAATNTQELQALTAESLQRMEQSGANISGQLLRLPGSSGSGSGIIPNYGGLGSNPSHYPHLASQSHGSHGAMGTAPPQKSSNGLLMVIVIGCFVLLALLIVVVGLRDRKAKGDPLAENGAASAQSAGTNTAGPPTGNGTGATSEGPTATPTPTDVASGGSPAVPPSATAATTKTSHGTAHTTPPKTTVTQKVTPPPPPPPPPPKPEEDPGFLTIQTTPWSKVTLNGKVICQTTPCNKVPIAPGSYVITLENAEKGIKKTHPVTIKSGEVTPKNIALD